MTNPSYNLILAPLMGWLTMMSVLVIAYLGRLELRERRKNRRLDEKRELLNRAPSVRTKTSRRLAIRAMTEISALESNCISLVRDFQKVDRRTTWKLGVTHLN